MLRFGICVTCVTAVCFAQNADLVIRNAHIYTVDLAKPAASVVAIRGNKIAYVGDRAGEWVGPETKQIDAGGKAVFPGFIDAHGHMESLGQALDSLDLRGVTSAQEIGARVQAAVQSRKPGEWIVGHAWDQNLWPGKSFPSKATLDAVAPANPVFLTRVDGHAAWVNSRALEQADVNGATPDPGGGKIVRDAGGQATGVLIDNAQQLVERKIPAPTLEQRKAWLERAAKACVQDGLTTVHDAGFGAETLRAYRELVAEHRLPVRIYGMILLPVAQGLWAKFQQSGPEIGDFLTIRALKLIADGALGSRGAALLEPYADDPGNSGLVILSRPYIEKVAREAVAAGFQVNTHAIGDRTNRTVLQAYGAVLGGANDKRFRVEHAQIVAPEDFARFRDNSIIASMQPTHATSDMPWAAARVGPRRIQGAYAWQTMRKLGVRVAFGSDFPVEDPNPLWGFYAAVTRQDAAGNPPGGWFPQQRFTRAEALRSWTVEGAYAAFEEHRKGSITVGKLADLIMLSDDIMQVAPEQIRKAHVVLTVIDGKIAYQQ